MTRVNNIDDVLVGKYALCEPIGHPGSYGVVRKAILQRDPTEAFAVKIMDRILDIKSQRDRIRHRLLDMELQISRTLSHPCIVKVAEVIVTTDKAYIVMENCLGGDVFDRIMSYGGRIPENAARTMFAQMCAAVMHLHLLNIVHGDIKLSNIMFASKDDTSLRLIDFGMAQSVANGQLLKDMVGTPNYQSPDIIHGSYSVETDAWSLGVVLFVMVFGFNPFDPFGSTDDNAVIQRRVLMGFSPTTKHGYGAFFPEAVTASALVKDLIAGLLHPNPLERMLMSEAFAHPWMTSQPLPIYIKHVMSQSAPAA